MDITIKWKQGEEWRDFPLSDILHESRSHAINLFSNSVPVIILEDGQYIVNTKELFQQYKQAGKRVMMLADCKASDKPAGEVGFERGDNGN